MIDEQKVKEIALKVFQEQLGQSQYQVTAVPAHSHNQTDSPRIPPTSVTNFVALPANNAVTPDAVSPKNGVLSSGNISPFNPPYGIIYPTPVIIGFGSGGGSPDYSAFNGGIAPTGSLVAFFNESLRFGQLWIALENPGVISDTLTGTVAMGATTATLTSVWQRVDGVYATKFSNGQVKNVTYTNGSANISWTGGLTSGATAAITITLPTQWYGITLGQFVG